MFAGAVLLSILVAGVVTGQQVDASLVSGADQTTPTGPELLSAARGELPPTDDSMWARVDSVSVGTPPSSFWRGLCLDPNGVHFWVTAGDGAPIVQKRVRATGALAVQFTGTGSGPYDLCRFGDSLCIASYANSRFDIYDTLGNFARSITSAYTGLRGVDWDGTKFWATTTSPYRVFTFTRGGALLKTLNPTVNPSWMGVITLDRTFANRFWISNGTGSTSNIHYCSFDTVSANTWSILATFTQATTSYPGGLGFDGPVSGGSFIWVINRSESWVWKVKVHEPLVTHDVGVSKLIAPTGNVDSGTSVTPACSVYNYGNQTETYKVRLRIGTFRDSATVTGHAAGARAYVAFPSWNAGLRGTYAVSCSTELAGDQVPSNDKKSDSVMVKVKDVGVSALAVPLAGATYPKDTVIAPKATWRNYGTQAASFEAWMFLADPTDARVYSKKVDVPGLASGGSLEVPFPVCTLKTAGAWTVRCSSYLVGDVKASNDTLDRAFTVASGGGPPPPGGGWAVRASVPSTPSGKAVKDGCWLAYDASRSRIYAAKGNKTGDFYSYNPASDSWKEQLTWPVGTEGKLPKAGSAGCADGNGVVYATKGNNTQGFWKYDAVKDSWYQKANVPLGPTNKKVKGGTDVVYVNKAGGCVYLLKGYKNEYWRYHVTGDSWHQLADAPAGSNLKWDKGSWLAYDNAHTIYAHKAKFHEFYKYDTDKDSWSPTALVAMPIPGSAGSKKSKDGGCGAYLSGGAIYALKGGNTREYWRYTVSANSWAEAETIPLGGGKKVKAGADIVTVGTKLYATKGNKTGEFYVYSPSTFFGGTPTHEGAATASLAGRHGRLMVSPNPLAAGVVTLRWQVPLAGEVRVSVSDVTGRCVLAAAGGRRGEMSLDLGRLAAGVYLVKVASGTSAVTEKLVVQR